MLARRSPRSWRTALAALTLLVPGLASAAPPGDTRAPRMAPAADERPLAELLDLDAGASCLDPELLLEHLLSWRDEASVDARISIYVWGDAQDPRVVGFEVQASGRVRVQRSFEPAPAACEDLHAVVGLAIAIALDDTLAGELGVVEPTRVGPAVQVGPGEGDLPRFDTPRRPDGRRRPVFGITAAAGLFAGLTPRLSAGGLLAFDLRPLDHFDLRVSALATHTPRVALDQGSVAVTVAAGRFDLCWGTAPLSVRLRLCGGFAAGATVAAGRGFGSNFQRAVPWLAAFAGVDLVVHLVGPLALELRVEGVFPVQRTRLDVRSESGQLLSSQLLPPAGLLVAVGPRLEF